MATFLALCQRAAGESGMMGSSYALPTTVVGQTGDEGQIVRWVADAWRRLQTSRRNWQWMQAEFSGNTVASTQRYAATDFSLTRFRAWNLDTDTEDDSGFSIYPTGDQSRELPLRYRPWPEFYNTYLRGSAASREGHPQMFSTDPARQLVLYPIPDAVYVVRGRYWKAAQELAADADVPEMPEDYHDLLWMGALLRVASNQESWNQMQVWQRDYDRLMTDLHRDQLPPLVVAGALA